MASLGKLYVCATPIGNLEDVTLRVLRVLGEVGLIAAEDTRRTRKLLSHHGIRNLLTSYHDRNAKTKAKQLVSKLKEGQNIALVSDAGTPGLADPGYKLIKSCLDEDIEVEVLPGPSAAISALVVSGLPTHSFIYEGFLPRKLGQRRRFLKSLTEESRTVVFYEAPHRVKETLKDILDVLGGRPVALVRELTKKFEQVLRGRVSEVLAEVEKTEPKGEIVLVLGGATKEVVSVDSGLLRQEVLDLIKRGMDKKEAISEIAQKLKVSKRQVYEAVKDIPSQPN